MGLGNKACGLEGHESTEGPSLLGAFEAGVYGQSWRGGCSCSRNGSSLGLEHWRERERDT